jgi:hypothetical protein
VEWDWLDKEVGQVHWRLYYCLEELEVELDEEVVDDEQEAVLDQNDEYQPQVYLVGKHSLEW